MEATDRRLEGNTAQRERLDEVLDRYDRFASRATKILVFLTIALMALGVAALLINARTNRLAHENTKRTQEAAALAHSIQNQRLTNIRSGCEDTNNRHDNTIAELNSLFSNPKLQHPHITVAQQKVQLQATVLLIDALVPKQNCSLLVARAQRDM